MAIPQFVTAEELSLNLKKHGIEITARRLTDLADHYQMPHTRCDGGPPLFRKQEAKDWIAANLLAEYSGRRMPTSLSVIDPRTLGGIVSGVPTVLVGMTDWLREFPLGLIRKGACVYFLIKRDEVVYVGKSDILAGRLMQHFNDKDFDRALFMRVPEDDACRIEGAFIRLLTPKYNSLKVLGRLPLGQLNEYSSRYMKAVSAIGDESDGEDAARLLGMIDRLDHDHRITQEASDAYRDDGASLMRLLWKVQQRFVEGDAYDANDEMDRKLAADLKRGLMFSRYSDAEWVNDMAIRDDQLAADKDPAP